MKYLLLLLLCLLSFAACTKGFDPLKVTAQTPVKECNAAISKTALAQSPFAGGSSKVHVNLPSEEILKSGTELSIVIDEECSIKTGSTWPGFQPKRKLENAIKKHVSFKAQLVKSLSVQQLEQLASQYNCVLGISLNQQMELFQTSIEALPNDPLIAEQHHLNAMNAAEGYDIFFNEKTGIKDTVTIAIIDTGLQMNHEDIVEHLWVNTAEVSGNGIDDDGNGYIDDIHGYNFAEDIPDTGHQTGTNPFGAGHGTPVTGLAAAIGGNGVGVTGIMKSNVKVMPLVVFDRNGGVGSVTVEEALRYAVDNGAKVINLSLGVYKKLDTMGDAIAYAVNNGAVVVAAAGNSGSELTETFWVSPASYSKQYEGAISVGSTKAKFGGKCSESNFSTSFVEIGAPGCDGIYTLQSGGSGYGSFGGTSSASPNIAGSAALVMGFVKSRTGEFPTPATVEQILRTMAREEANLLNFFSGAKHIDLRQLAIGLDQMFPYQPKPEPCP